jgi:hypothetical protein
VIDPVIDLVIEVLVPTWADAARAKKQHSKWRVSFQYDELWTGSSDRVLCTEAGGKLQPSIREC